MSELIFYFNRIKKRLLTGAAILLPAITMAQKYTLNDILDKIERANPSLTAYQNRANASYESAKGARAWMPPKVGVEWDMMPYNLNYYNGSMLRISAMQGFPNPKKNAAMEDYLKSMADVEKYGGEYQKVLLFAEAKETYYKLYISQRKIAVLQESSEALKLMIDLATKQMAITKGDLASIYKLKGRLAENETMILHEENVIRALFATLNYLMNENVNQAFDIDTSGLMKNYKGLSTYLSIDSIDYKRSDIMKIQGEINTLQLNQRYISLQKKPEFGMKVEHYERFDMPNAFSVMGTMTIPSVPWSAKSYRSEARALDYKIAALENDKKNTVNMALQTIKMYLIELESENKELANYQQNVIPAYRKSLNANLLAYGQNTSEMNMTLFAWDDLITAQMAYIKHMENYLNIQTEYEKALQIR